MYKLRDNQVDPVKIGIEFFRSGNKRPSLIVAPVGFGKAILQAYIAEGIKDLGKVLVLQPSKELLEQNYEKFTSLGGHATIFSASLKSKKLGDVTYATIGSIKDIGGVFKENNYKFLIIDEADRYPRNGDSMLGKFLKTSGIKSVLGLTATPFKLQSFLGWTGINDSKLTMLTTRNKQGTFFKDIIHVTQIQDLIRDNYWSRLIYEEHEFDQSDLVYNTSRAEFTDESIERAYENQDLHSKIVRRIETLDRNSIVVFVPTVDDAKRLAKRIPNSVAVYGDMPSKDREQAILRFKARSIRVAINVNVLSIGFDYPEIDCIIQARPTASLSVYYQQQGRGVRLHPLKKNCLIIDFVGGIKKFGVISDFVFKQEDVWKLYSRGKLLTGVPISRIGEYTESSEKQRIEEKTLTEFERKEREQSLKHGKIVDFGKFKGQAVHEIPEWWHDWMLKNFNFDRKTEYIKEEILRLKECKV